MYGYFTLFLCFLLGSYNGYIALFRQGNPNPIQVFPYSIASLPEADQQLLTQGIPISSYQQLQMLLEDYLS